MRIAGPWEVPLPADEDRQRRQIRAALDRQSQQLWAEAQAAGPAALVEANRVVSRNRAVAVLSIPDSQGWITPLPQDPGLELVHDPYGVDAAYLILTQLRYQKQLLRRRLHQGEIDGAEYRREHDRCVQAARQQVVLAAQYAFNQTGEMDIDYGLLSDRELDLLLEDREPLRRLGRTTAQKKGGLPAAAEPSA